VTSQNTVLALWTQYLSNTLREFPQIWHKCPFGQLPCVLQISWLDESYNHKAGILVFSCSALTVGGRATLAERLFAPDGKEEVGIIQLWWHKSMNDLSQHFGLIKITFSTILEKLKTVWQIWSDCSMWQGEILWSECWSLSWAERKFETFYEQTDFILLLGSQLR